MAPVTVTSSHSRGSSARHPARFERDVLADSYPGIESHHPMQKDQTELELEKAVFGDEAGFHNELASHSLDALVYGSESEESGQEHASSKARAEEGLEAVNDEDVGHLVPV